MNSLEIHIQVHQSNLKILKQVKILDCQVDKNKLLMQLNQWMQSSKYKIEYINLKCAKQLRNLI